MSGKLFKIFIVLFVVAFLAIIMLVSPIFHVTNVEITGINKLKKENIIETLKLKGGTENIFAFNSINAKKILKANAYVKDVSIRKIIPDTLQINIKERVPRGYIQNSNAYLYIDGEGRVLETKAAKDEKLPLLVGLQFEQAVIGQILDVANKESFAVLIDLSKQLEKYSLYENISGVDISDIDNIHIFVNNDNLDVCFGKYMNADWKISAIKEILANISASYRGQLLVGDKGDDIIFVPYR